MKPGWPLIVTVTPSTVVGNRLLTKSNEEMERLVAARFVPLMVMKVLGAIPPAACAAFVIALAATLGFAWMLPSIPCFWPPGPAVKYTALLSPPLPPLPKYRAHRRGSTMLLPLGSCKVPWNAPVAGSYALIMPSPKLPTSRLLANLPNVAGAMARPHGEFRRLPDPPATSDCRSLPVESNTLTQPFPTPATSNFLLASCLAYAKQDANKKFDVAGVGNGWVSVFDSTGKLLQSLVAGGTGSLLNSPWGLAMAPATFGKFAGTLLVGNFGDGMINAYDPTTGAFQGTLQDPSGNNIVLPGLWSLYVGNGGSGGD